MSTTAPVAVSNEDERRWPDRWLRDGDNLPAAGAFPSRFEYAHALSEALAAEVLDYVPTTATRIASRAVDALTTIAAIDADFDGCYALSRLQKIAREVLP
jgi:hypothetical protein